MCLGLVTYQWGKDMTLPVLIETCEKSGVLGVEVRTEHAHGVEPTLGKAERADVNGDGSVTMRDAEQIISCAVGSCESLPAEFRASCQAHGNCH